MKIDESVAIVTGAARGIGRGYVEAMLGNGAKVGIKGDKGHPTEQTGKCNALCIVLGLFSSQSLWMIIVFKKISVQTRKEILH